MKWRKAVIMGLMGLALPSLSKADFSTAVTDFQNKRYEPALKEFSRLSGAGDVRALTNLGIMYLNGFGVEKPDATLAVTYFRDAAEKGFAPAQSYLGISYQRCRGVPCDNQAALQWLQKAAGAHDVTGMTALGILYEEGTAVPTDEATAAVWFGRAAEKKDATAALRLARMYAAGRGVPTDISKARYWYRQSVMFGGENLDLDLAWLDEDEQRDLRPHPALDHWIQGTGARERLCRSGICRAWVGGHWRRMDDADLLAKDKTQAAQGDALASYDLAYKYQYGAGVPKDAFKAAALYKDAAERGHSDAYAALGQLYENGVAGLPDLTQAATFYMKAAQQNNAWGKVRLGMMYRDGRGVRRDAKKAWTLCQAAAQEGKSQVAAQANFCIGTLYLHGLGVTRDPIKALRRLRQGAQDWSEGSVRLGEMFWNGEDLPHDYSEAAHWLKNAQRFSDHYRDPWWALSSDGKPRDVEPALRKYLAVYDQSARPDAAEYAHDLCASSVGPVPVCLKIETEFASQAQTAERRFDWKARLKIRRKEKILLPDAPPYAPEVSNVKEVEDRLVRALRAGTTIQPSLDAYLFCFGGRYYLSPILKYEHISPMRLKPYLLMAFALNHAAPAALDSFAALGLKDADVLQAYHAALRDPEPSVVVAGMKAIAKLGAEARSFVPAISDLLHGSAWVGVEAAHILGAMGRNAQPAVPALARAVDMDDVLVARAALFALVRIAPWALQTKDALKRAHSRSDQSLASVATILEKPDERSRSNDPPGVNQEDYQAFDRLFISTSVSSAPLTSTAFRTCGRDVLGRAGRVLTLQTLWPGDMYAQQQAIVKFPWDEGTTAYIMRAASVLHFILLTKDYKVSDTISLAEDSMLEGNRSHMESAFVDLNGDGLRDILQRRQMTCITPSTESEKTPGCEQARLRPLSGKKGKDLFQNQYGAIRPSLLKPSGDAFAPMTLYDKGMKRLLVMWISGFAITTAVAAPQDRLASLNTTGIEAPQQTIEIPAADIHAYGDNAQEHCYVFPSFVALETDSGQVGAEAIVARLRGGDEPLADLCNVRPRSGDRTLDGATGFVLGAAGPYLFVSSTDSDGSSGGIAVFQARNGKKLIDVARNTTKPFVVNPQDAGVWLHYYLTLQSECDVSEATCWDGTLKKNGVPADVILVRPECKVRDPASQRLLLSVPVSVSESDHPQIHFENGQPLCEVISRPT